MKKLIPIVFAAVTAGTVSAHATAVEFVPPNDPTGGVYSTNSNDAWGNARGIGFEVSGDTSISSVGVYQDLTGVDLSFGIYEISALSGAFSRDTTLRSGSATTTTSGLEWVDFGFSELTFSAGTNYLIEFSFSGNSNQNFFYGNSNASWDQASYLSLEGTTGASFRNSVVGAFRVDADVPPPVPVPAALPLLVGALGGLGIVARRRKAA